MLGRQNKIYLIQHFKIYCFIFVSKQLVFRNTRSGGKQEANLAELLGGEAGEEKQNDPDLAAPGQTGQEGRDRDGKSHPGQHLHLPVSSSSCP